MYSSIKTQRLKWYIHVMSFVIFIAPSKTFSKHTLKGTSRPLFEEKTNHLLSTLKSLDENMIINTMKVSPKIANEVFNYYQNSTGGRAMSLFSGVSYKAMQASNLEVENNKVYILDALYGLIRPDDNIHRYRLDFTMNVCGNLYEYWKKPIEIYMQKRHKHDVLIDLSSKEFSPLISDCPNVYRIDFTLAHSRISNVLLKQMRGKMTRYLLDKNINSLTELQKIKIEGFEYNPQLSSSTNFIFTRLDS